MQLMERERSFGAGDMLVCAGCGNEMSATRRTPDPAHGEVYELQTFECWACGNVLTRSVDKAGNPPA
jgi:hypothetical protein